MFTISSLTLGFGILIVALLAYASLLLQSLKKEIVSLHQAFQNNSIDSPLTLKQVKTYSDRVASLVKAQNILAVSLALVVVATILNFCLPYFLLAPVILSIFSLALVLWSLYIFILEGRYSTEDTARYIEKLPYINVRVERRDSGRRIENSYDSDEQFNKNNKKGKNNQERNEQRSRSTQKQGELSSNKREEQTPREEPQGRAKQNNNQRRQQQSSESRTNQLPVSTSTPNNKEITTEAGNIKQGETQTRNPRQEQQERRRQGRLKQQQGEGQEQSNSSDIVALREDASQEFHTEVLLNSETLLDGVQAVNTQPSTTPRPRQQERPVRQERRSAEDVLRQQASLREDRATLTPIAEQTTQSHHTQQVIITPKVTPEHSKQTNPEGIEVSKLIEAEKPVAQLTPPAPNALNIVEGLLGQVSIPQATRPTSRGTFVRSNPHQRGVSSRRPNRTRNAPVSPTQSSSTTE